MLEQAQRGSELTVLSRGLQPLDGIEVVPRGAFCRERPVGDGRGHYTTRRGGSVTETHSKLTPELQGNRRLLRRRARQLHPLACGRLGYGSGARRETLIGSRRYWARASGACAGAGFARAGEAGSRASARRQGVELRREHSEAERAPGSVEVARSRAERAEAQRAPRRRRRRPGKGDGRSLPPAPDPGGAASSSEASTRSRRRVRGRAAVLTRTRMASSGRSTSCASRDI
jgi:hypothetical protein